MELCHQLKIDSASEMDEYSVYALRDKGTSPIAQCVLSSTSRSIFGGDHQRLRRPLEISVPVSIIWIVRR